jgi:hypothetical protein
MLLILLLSEVQNWYLSWYRTALRLNFFNQIKHIVNETMVKNCINVVRHLIENGMVGLSPLVFLGIHYEVKKKMPDVGTLFVLLGTSISRCELLFRFS